ncbi:MAG: serine/threonine protein kinase [Acidobacteria bacterium]|nr:serine/threonine protein kinase [Acidobacteriota bacterium]
MTSDQSTPELPSTLQPGARIGRYTLVRQIGQGGMGAVYLAEQAEPIRREVALKVIRPNIEQSQFAQRFELERQALARMTHPGIARVFDAGAGDNGLPYFVMEYFPGSPITDYCDERRLPVAERLKLLDSVCQAVQHAHDKGILHRDLKPSNLLVADLDGQPVVKVIDFGLARLLERPSSEGLTESDALLGTPAYLSPEQIRSGSSAVDVRSDVYSLGVVLYQLLTGFLPTGAEACNNLMNLLSTLEDEPIPPGTRVALAPDLAGIAAARAASGRELVRALHGELDWIALKAVAKDPGRRYASMRELAADLRRFLDHRPVLAGPAGRLYRTRKLIRRHRLGFLATTLALLAVLAGIGGLAVGLTQARQAERTALGEAEKARAINAFLEEMLSSADPAKQGRDVKVADVLDRAAARLDHDLADQPEVAAALHFTLGRTYQGLGRLAEADRQLSVALDLTRRTLGEESPEALDRMRELAWNRAKLGRLVEAAALDEKVIRIARARLGPEHPLVVRSLGELATFYHRQEDTRQAEVTYREALRLAEKVLGPDVTETGRILTNLAGLLVDMNRPGEAEPLIRRAIAIQERTRGAEHPLTLLAMRRLAEILEARKNTAAAESAYRSLLDVTRRVMGPRHQDTLSLQARLAQLINVPGREAETETVIREVLSARRQALGETHVHTFLSYEDLGNFLLKANRVPEAAGLLAPVVVSARAELGEDNRFAVRLTLSLAQARLRLKQPAEAERLARRLLLLKEQGRWPTQVELWKACSLLGEGLLLQGRQAEAEITLRQALKAEGRSGGKDSAVLASLRKLAAANPDRPAIDAVLRSLGGAATPAAP